MPPSDALDLRQSVALLERTPALLDAWLRDLPDDWVRCTEGPDTWSPYDVVGHLIDGEETDWIPRARLILDRGATEAFTPFDRFAHLSRASESLDERLDRFGELRRESLAALESMRLTTDDLSRLGRHPALGDVTLGQLLAAWTAHDLTHVVQVARTMARRYRDAVGPWREYLRVVADLS